MNQVIKSNEYDVIIRKIRKKRNVIIILTIIAELIALMLCTPSSVVLMDEVIVDYKGINPVITVLIVLFIFFCAVVAYGFALTPMTMSMDVECDPKKHFVLNTELNKQKTLVHIYAVDYIYMGDFRTALIYANEMVASGKPKMVNTGIFNKARCEFFLGDFNSLKLTVNQFESNLSGMKTTNPKVKIAYDKIQKTMQLLVAIADGDKEAIAACRNIEVWNNSKATEGYVNYLKGLAAYNLGDKLEAIYRFMDVKENCAKTVFAQLAEQHLLNFNSDI